MPQKGERWQDPQTGKTIEWAGDGWHPVGEEEPQGSALGRFLGGALSTSPLNPMNLVRALSHPVDTAKSLVTEPIKQLGEAGRHAADTITGDAPEGRLVSALKAFKHLGGSVPLIGKASIDAGEKIGEGDIAGGAGELTGLASAAAVPKVVSRTPGAISSVGSGMENVGSFAKAHGPTVFGHTATLPEMAATVALERLYRGNVGQAAVGAGVAAAPYALEAGGRGLQRLGSALEGLKHRGNVPEGPQWDPSRPPPKWMPRSAAADPYQTQMLYEEAIKNGYSDVAARKAAGMDPLLTRRP